MRFWKSPAAPRHSSFRSRLLEHRILLLLLNFLETLFLLHGLLLFQTLLRLFLHLPPLLRLRLIAFCFSSSISLRRFSFSMAFFSSRRFCASFCIFLLSSAFASSHFMPFFAKA